MARQRHYKNFAGPGEAVFVTTTCLDFAHLFQRDEMKERMAFELCRACADHGAKLGAFVIMSHHIHFVAVLPAEKGVGWFVQRLKSASAFRMTPFLLPSELTLLGEQTGLNGRRFWQRSFRSITIRDSQMYWQRVKYVHSNPIRAGLVDDAAMYRWCSAWMFEQGWWDELDGLRVPADYWRIDSV